jgi:hypothetical protein
MGSKRMSYEDAIKDLIYRYLEFVDLDEEKREKFIQMVYDIIKE